MALGNISLSDMPWLGKPADPAESFARGMAQGQSFASKHHEILEAKARMENQIANTEIARERLSLERELTPMKIAESEARVRKMEQENREGAAMMPHRVAQARAGVGKTEAETSRIETMTPADVEYKESLINQSEAAIKRMNALEPYEIAKMRKELKTAEQLYQQNEKTNPDVAAKIKIEADTLREKFIAQTNYVNAQTDSIQRAANLAESAAELDKVQAHFDMAIAGAELGMNFDDLQRRQQKFANEQEDREQDKTDSLIADQIIRDFNQLAGKDPEAALKFQSLYESRIHELNPAQSERVYNHINFAMKSNDNKRTLAQINSDAVRATELTKRKDALSSQGQELLAQPGVDATPANVGLLEEFDKAVKELSPGIEGDQTWVQELIRKSKNGTLTGEEKGYFEGKLPSQKLLIELRDRGQQYADERKQSFEHRAKMYDVGEDYLKRYGIDAIDEDGNIIPDRLEEVRKKMLAEADKLGVSKTASGNYTESHRQSMIGKVYTSLEKKAGTQTVRNLPNGTTEIVYNPSADFDPQEALRKATGIVDNIFRGQMEGVGMTPDPESINNPPAQSSTDSNATNAQPATPAQPSNDSNATNAPPPAPTPTPTPTIPPVTPAQPSTDSNATPAPTAPTPMIPGTNVPRPKTNAPPIDPSTGVPLPTGATGTGRDRLNLGGVDPQKEK